MLNNFNVAGILIISFVNSFVFPVKSYGQRTVADLITTSTVLINFPNIGSGSGILVTDSNYIFLVTARHVLFDFNVNTKDATLIGNEAYLTLYTNNAYSDKKDSLRINLSILNKNQDMLYDREHDIAIIRIAKVMSIKINSDKSVATKYNYLTGVTKAHTGNLALPSVFIDLLLKLTNVDVGEETFMHGYPESLKVESVFDFDRPLMRKGIVAGIDRKLETIVIDSPSYPGNSGGPVFELSYNLGKAPKLYSRIKILITSHASVKEILQKKSNHREPLPVFVRQKHRLLYNI